jgi:hypothetical protein
VLYYARFLHASYPASKNEQKQLLSQFYAQIDRLDGQASVKGEEGLVIFLKFNPWKEEIQKAGAPTVKAGKRAAGAGIALSVLGAGLALASPPAGALVAVIGINMLFFGWAIKVRHTHAVRVLGKLKDAHWPPYGQQQN